jgi:hypothetical protein
MEACHALLPKSFLREQVGLTNLKVNHHGLLAMLVRVLGVVIGEELL